MDVDSGAHFEYREWEVRVEVTGAGEAFSGRADLLRKGEHKCRLVLSTTRLDATAARLALGTKARNFIDNWISRNESGQSPFSGLGCIAATRTAPGAGRGSFGSHPAGRFLDAGGGPPPDVVGQSSA